MRKGAGAYMCGEETALLEHRGQARHRARQTAAARAGRPVWQPTVINNVITLASVPIILARRAPTVTLAWAARTARCRFSWRATSNMAGWWNGLWPDTAELLYDYGGGSATGRPIKAVQVGGPLGATARVAVGHSARTTKPTPPSARALAMAASWCDDQADLSRLAPLRHGILRARIVRQVRTPCRIGSTRGVEVIDKIRASQQRPQRVALLHDLCDTMVMHGSLCAMGSMTPIPSPRPETFP